MGGFFGAVSKRDCVLDISKALCQFSKANMVRQ